MVGSLTRLLYNTVKLGGRVSVTVASTLIFKMDVQRKQFRTYKLQLEK